MPIYIHVLKCIKINQGARSSLMNSVGMNGEQPQEGGPRDQEEAVGECGRHFFKVGIPLEPLIGTILSKIFLSFESLGTIVRNAYRGSYVTTGAVETNKFACYISVILYRFRQYNEEGYILL